MKKTGLSLFLLAGFFLAQSQTDVPACATRVAPADSAVNITAPQAIFTWVIPSDAYGCLFKLGKTSSPDSIDFITESGRYYSNLAYSTTYYWSVVPANAAGSASGCPVYSFTTMAAPPIPVNDEPAGAIAIASGTSVSAYTRSATQTSPADSCNGTIGNANDDVWFTFTPTQSGYATITLTPDLIFDAVINAYSGTPGSFISIACADSGVEGQQETLSLPNLNAGETYYFRVYGFGDAGKDGSFSLAASGITLPVGITGFKGEQNGLQNILSWITLTEQNNKGFELQRSANGRDFTSLAFISSMGYGGNSSEALHYKFVDIKPISGNCYYRLKQVDKDGRSKISSIVLLQGLQRNTFALSNLYPNPAKTNLNLTVTAPSVNRANIMITDIAGKCIMRQAVQLSTGNNNFSFDVHKLLPGSYLIKIAYANGSETAVSRFVRQ